MIQSFNSTHGSIVGKDVGSIVGSSVDIVGDRVLVKGAEHVKVQIIASVFVMEAITQT